MTSVSIVVPARNEEDLLPSCLEALLAQDYEGPIQIIIVDNGSTDRTAERAAALGVTVVNESRHGYVIALARGFSIATGDIVATTDADTVPPRNWISTLVREYEKRPDVVAVGGEIFFREPNWKGWLFTRCVLPHLNRWDRKNPAGPHLWGANFSVRRDVFERAGGWSPHFNLQCDTELSERLRPFGRVVLLDHLAVSTSCRRWNQSFVRSVFLYASNFVWLQIAGRPLWRGFPEIREVVASESRVSLGTLPWSFSLKSARTVTAVALFSSLILLGGYDTLTPWSNAFGKTYWEGATKERVVALTFDDGPNGPFTDAVLDILHREGVKATFFLIGKNARLYPDVAARIAREGHVIGNHTDSHPAGFALATARFQRAEIDRAEESIHAVTGVYPHLFRPPQGIRSPWMMQVLAKDSLVTVTWDDAPGDWVPYSSRQLAASTIAHAHPGAIILLHDGLNLARHPDRSATVEALPTIIDRLREEGYRFVTVPELLRYEPTLARWPALTPAAAVAPARRGTFQLPG
ncbi:MAG TPA: glycosyltransferase [Candidatus Binatia bacterium]|nr:glycosyltransferase [Candidatus Binatia bacterium]